MDTETTRPQDGAVTQSPASFEELGLDSKLVKAYNDLNYFIPTPIQAKSIPLGLQGKDLISQSKAGTGKTLAFLGILFSKLQFQDNTVQGLIVLPTRELAFQVFDVLRRIAKKLTPAVCCESACFIGGIPIENDRTKLRSTPIHVIIGTPGRLKALLKEKAFNIDKLKVLVLDEADKLLDAKGFGEDVYNIVGKVKGQCQILAYSATIQNKTIDDLQKYMGQPEVVYLAKVEAEAIAKTTSEPQNVIPMEEEKQEKEDRLNLNAMNLQQYFVRVTGGEKGTNAEKNQRVIEILKNVDYDQAIIFYNDKGLGEDLASDLR